MKGLRFVLIALAVYMTVVGGLFLFAPRMAESAFQMSLSDPALTPLYGQVLITIALMAYLVSTDLQKHAKLVWAFVFAEAGHILIFGYQLINGISTFAQVGPPLIIATIFLVPLIVLNRPARS